MCGTQAHCSVQSAVTGQSHKKKKNETSRIRNWQSRGRTEHLQPVEKGTAWKRSTGSFCFKKTALSRRDTGHNWGTVCLALCISSAEKEKPPKKNEQSNASSSSSSVHTYPSSEAHCHHVVLKTPQGELPTASAKISLEPKGFLDLVQPLGSFPKGPCSRG